MDDEKSSQAEDPVDDSIRVTSATGRYSTTITHAAMSLIAGVGIRDDEKSVLVPFVECEIAIDRAATDGLATPANQEEHSILITLENAAFLAEAFSSAFAKLAPDLVSLSQGSLQPVADRITYAIDRLQQTRSNIATLTDVLEELSGQMNAQS
ncbi:hypothetical protein Swit_4963 (plasmid) [Rhizorhabdus wittichii RW1]|uniref:Uncharacterized protein n=1 Tax=Rhizorhabdus wittichii (strain DSM 6014 / CCUG 31198 / JCM 15750 / NBRC 105917 / EY 4224 / RW1) TaxID=392499 RepID=A0A9J9HGV4_RHIWR|nr:hypothetical protein Swit_4963 [Rhizorhabdus wittichii RW1]